MNLYYIILYWNSKNFYTEAEQKTTYLRIIVINKTKTTKDPEETCVTPVP